MTPDEHWRDAMVAVLAPLQPDAPSATFDRVIDVFADSDVFTSEDHDLIHCSVAEYRPVEVEPDGEEQYGDADGMSAWAVVGSIEVRSDSADVRRILAAQIVETCVNGVRVEGANAAQLISVTHSVDGEVGAANNYLAEVRAEFYYYADDNPLGG